MLGFCLVIRRFLLWSACLGDVSEVQVVGFLLSGLESACLGDVNRVQVGFCWVVRRERVNLWE